MPCTTITEVIFWDIYIHQYVFGISIHYIYIYSNQSGGHLKAFILVQSLTSKLSPVQPYSSSKDPHPHISGLQGSTPFTQPGKHTKSY